MKSYRLKFSKKILVPVLYFILAIPFFIKLLGFFQTSINDLHRQLGKKVITKHFQIYLPSELTTEHIFFIQQLHEFYYEEIKLSLGEHIDGKISSFIFRNSDEKRELFGAGNADVSKPWSKQIFIEYDNIQSVLKHELAHIFSRNFSSNFLMLADKYNPAMIEGFATAIENNFHGNDNYYAASLLYKSNYKIKFKELFSSFNFFYHTPSVGYLYSGAFIRFLMEKYGLHKVKLLYGDINFEKHFRKNIDALEKEFFEFIDEKKYEFNPHRVQLYFSGLPLIRKVCARQVSNQLKHIAIEISKNNYISASQQYRKLYSATTNMQALSGLIYSLRRQHKYLEAKKLILKEINKSVGTGYYFFLKIQLADLLFLTSHFSDAERTYCEIIKMDLNFEYNVHSSFRLELLRKNKLLLLDFLEKKFNENYLINLFENCNKEYFSFVLSDEIIKYDKIYNRLKNFLFSVCVKNQNFDMEIYMRFANLIIEKNDYEALKKLTKILKSAKIIKSSQNYIEQIRKFEWILDHKGLS